jgi:hypothetical protein
MSSLIHTSGVVYRYSSFRSNRFEEKISRAEDYLFFLSLLQKAGSAAFCAKPGFDVGRGVSISRSDWGAIENLKGSQDQTKVLQYILRNFSFSPSECKEVEGAYRASISNLAVELLHHLRRGRLHTCAPIILDNPALIPAMGVFILQRCAAGIQGASPMQ